MGGIRDPKHPLGITYPAHFPESEGSLAFPLGTLCCTQVLGHVGRCFRTSRSGPVSGTWGLSGLQEESSKLCSTPGGERMTNKYNWCDHEVSPYKRGLRPPASSLHTAVPFIVQWLVCFFSSLRFSRDLKPCFLAQEAFSPKKQLKKPFVLPSPRYGVLDRASCSPKLASNFNS